MKKLRASCMSLALLCSYATSSYTHQIKTNRHIEASQRRGWSWSEVQQETEAAVVQIFAYRFERDIIEPYMMPYQRESRGSGFFIQFEGNPYIVTNAHVVDQSVAIHVRMPLLDQRGITAELVSICHDRDLALLKIADEEFEYLLESLGGSIPYLELGDSNNVSRADEVLVMGYPLGEETINVNSGMISGFKDQFIRMSAALNPGNSGGPLLNDKGEVIGINTERKEFTGDGRVVQNIGCSTPVNRLKIILPQMMRTKLVKKPSLGIVSSHASNMAEYLGNPIAGGSYLSEILPGSPLDKAGIKKGDMLYEVDGHVIDIYGDIRVPWSKDRISIVEYISSIGYEDDIKVVVYRNGERIECTVNFESDTDIGIRRIYPGYETIDYEVFAGMVVMQLTINHIEILGQQVQGLKEYGRLKNQSNRVLVVTHVLPTSALFLTRTIGTGVVLQEVNGKPVSTLEEFRAAIQETKGRAFLTLRASDTVGGLTDNICVALHSDEVLNQEAALAQKYGYKLSPTVKEILGS